MRKILFLFGMLIVSMPCFAKNIDSLYVVKQVKLDNYIGQLQNKLKQPTIKETVIYSISEDPYYMKLYPDGDNLNVFLNCDKKSKEKYEAIIKSADHKIYTLTDKDLMAKYSSEFKQFILANKLDVKGVQVKEEKNSYNPYDKKLKNKIVKTINYQEDNINFTVNKMLMKSKIKKYVNGYEILITNNTGKDIILNKASTADFVGLTEIAKKAAILQGVDFVPVYGIVAGVKTDLEKNRFSRPFPNNYTIKNGEKVRLLGMAERLVEPIIDFSFTINGKEKNIQLQTYQQGG